jgi:hypothetical protein
MPRTILRVIFGAAIGSAPLLAIFMMGESVPLERLISNTASGLRQDPKNANGYYLMGRLESLAFAHYTEASSGLRSGALFPDLYYGVPEHPTRQVAGRLQKSDIEHANASLENYKRAVELDPKSPLFHFSLGWMQQECSRFADQLGRSAHEWIDMALAEYRTAYRLALPENLKETYYLVPFLADQAGSAIIEILKQRGVQENDPEIAEITKNVTVLRGKSRAVTPIIFSTRPAATLADLVSDRRVSFDLDGFTTGQWWPWLQPDTCILVWDPNRTGRIASGRQLFGSVT